MADKANFDIFDIDGDGCISVSELHLALYAMGCNPTVKEAEALAQQCPDPQKINWQQFQSILGQTRADNHAARTTSQASEKHMRLQTASPTVTLCVCVFARVACSLDPLLDACCCALSAVLVSLLLLLSRRLPLGLLLLSSAPLHPCHCRCRLVRLASTRLAPCSCTDLLQPKLPALTATLSST